MLEIRPLCPADVSAALRLSTQARWNQLEADWRRLIDLWPQTCLAGWEGDQLVATGTLATFGERVGWIGMILVDEACRGRGMGGEIFDAIMAIAQKRGVQWLGLDATDMGRPVYLKRGFVDAAKIDRWMRQPASAAEESVPRPQNQSITDSVNPDLWPDVLALDLAATGVDRRGLLEHLAAEPGAQMRLLWNGQRAQAAGFYRQGRTADAIGPLVAESTEAAVEILLALLAAAPPEWPIFIDALRAGPFGGILAELGFAVQRRLTRMMHPAAGNELTTPRVFAAAGFELG